MRAQFAVSQLDVQTYDKDAIYSNVRDDRGRACMLIKVKTSDKTFGFDTSPSHGVIEVQTPDQKHPDETWVFIKSNTKYFRILHPRYGLPRQGEGMSNGFLVVPINQGDKPSNLDGIGMVYRCVVSFDNNTVEDKNVVEAKKTPHVVVTTNPNKSWLTVDDKERVTTPRVLDLNPGIHEFIFNAKDCRTLSVSFDASTISADTTFHYDLTKLHGTVQIEAEEGNPMFSFLGIREMGLRQTNSHKRCFTFKPYPDKYLVFATAWRHRMQMRVAKVKDGDSLNYSFRLKPIPLHFFAIPTISKPSGLNDLAYGGMIGFVRRRGLYFSMQSTKNYKSNGEKILYSDMKYLAENPYLNSSHCYFRSVSGGVIFRLWSPVHVYAGWGIGEREFTWDGRDGKRHCVDNYYDHIKGSLKEYGILVNIWKIGLVGGVMEYEGTKNAQLGIGIYW